MSMLISKSKIKEDNIRIYQIIIKGVRAEAMTIQQVIMDRGLFRQTITVIYSLLINFTVPIRYKMNALDLLKLLFQSAYQTVIDLTARVITVLVDIARQNPEKNQEEVGSSPQLRSVPAHSQQRLILYAKQILKQWSQYLIDCNGSNPEYTAALEKAKRNGTRFPQYFTFFTMRDYIEFMLNWMRMNKKETDFRDKLEIYHFLTNENVYRDKLTRFRVALHQYAELLVYESYSLLINHSIPVTCKFVVLQSLKDLYEEGNHIYCHRADQIILPYFTHIVDLIEHDSILLKRFFEKVQKRYDLQQNSSVNYINTILQLIKQWSLYQGQDSTNPFEGLVATIDRNKMLDDASPLFKSNDLQKFRQNRTLGSHRRKQYEIPLDPVLSENKQLQRLRALVRDYQSKQSMHQDQMRQLQIKVNSYDKALTNRVVNLREQTVQTDNLIVDAIPLTSSYIENPIMFNRQPVSTSKKSILKQKQSSLIQQVEQKINTFHVTKANSSSQPEHPEERKSSPNFSEYITPRQRKSATKSNRNSALKLSDVLQINANRISFKKQG